MVVVAHQAMWQLLHSLLVLMRCDGLLRAIQAVTTVRKKGSYLQGDTSNNR